MSFLVHSGQKPAAGLPGCPDHLDKHPDQPEALDLWIHFPPETVSNKPHGGKYLSGGWKVEMQRGERTGLLGILGSTPRLDLKVGVQIFQCPFPASVLSLIHI